MRIVSALNLLPMAEWFTDLYYKEVIDFFLHPLNVYGYNTLANTLKIAIDENVISLNDFLLDDKAVLKKLFRSNNQQITNLLAKLHPNVKVKEDEEAYDIHVTKKPRIIDPLVCLDGIQLEKASEVSPIVKKLNQNAIKKVNKGAFVKVVSS
ncbi:hypothetical protein HOO54_12170 [Bacillus sp. WMMC1349]|uniref:hypothetical protein n=1 Tax=Bacillus sp. WMMC1349 TaxID=2736254 RepID=UPI0015559B82|nr:hypothetical protein [Bacillus sp. WMMC1349]NPC92964.1 hypothetical protein [Bacillus sp. WMMC1349]